MMEKRVCCICGKVIEGWGNDPYPVRDEGVCCYECNVKYVIPARILAITGVKKANKEGQDEDNK